jgi:hypothetical protein
MEAKTKKKLWIILAVIVGIFVLAPTIPFIALIALDSSEKSNNQAIEQLISNRDYDKAREKANKLDRDDKEQALAKINKAQLSVMVVNNSVEDAQYLAQELNAMPEFFEVLEHNVQKIYARDFRGLYNMLTRYPIEATYHAELKHLWYSDLEDAEKYAAGGSDFYKDDYLKTNVGYNTEVGKYNKLVMQVIDLASFDGNNEYLRKLLPLLKPEAVETQRNWEEKEHYYLTIKYKLDNKAKSEAQRKIKEAGINL